MTREDRDAVSAAAALFKSRFRPGEAETGARETVALSTGSLALDHALGTGGIPRGTIVELLGPESGGKTTLALHLAGNAQAAGWKVRFIDADFRFSKEQARNIGLDLGGLEVIQGEDGEALADAAIAGVAEGMVVVIDSLVGLVPARSPYPPEIAQPRLLAALLRKLEEWIAPKGGIAICTNQIRARLSGPRVLGWHVTSAGGSAVKAGAALRIYLEKGETVKDDSDARCGVRIHAEVLKNREGDVFTTARFELDEKGRINREAELLDLGLALGIFERVGSAIYYVTPGGERPISPVGRGRAAAIRSLEILNTAEVEARIVAKLFPAKETA